MDDWVWQLLAQLPLVAAVFWLWRADRREFNSLEAKREENRSADEQARNGQFSALIGVLATFNTTVASLRDTLDGKLAALDRLEGHVTAEHEATREALQPLRAGAVDTAAALAAIQHTLDGIHTGQQVITGVVQTLARRGERQETAQEGLQSSVDALAEGLVSYSAAVQATLEELQPIVEALKRSSEAARLEP